MLSVEYVLCHILHAAIHTCTYVGACVWGGVGLFISLELDP